MKTNFGVYALRVAKKLNEGRIEPMSGEYFDEHIFANTDLFAQAMEITDGISERPNDRLNGGLKLYMIEDACSDVPVVLKAVTEVGTETYDLAPNRAYADALIMFIRRLCVLDQKDREPYIAKIFVDETERLLKNYDGPHTFAKPSLYKLHAVCLGLWDTDLM